jgi:membrane protein implicated in regulation of membrane protease activity
MSTVIRYLPGLIGAVAAFVTLKVLILLGFATLGFEILGFSAVYLVVTVLADKAMRAYHNTER